MDAGSVVNTALVAGTPPTGAPVTDTDSVTTPVPAAPAITLDKQAGAPSGTTAGSTIAYTFLVTNTGNVTLTAVAISDAQGRSGHLPGDHAGSGRDPRPARATYTLTQADVDAGHVANTATASRAPRRSGAPVSATDTTDTPVTTTPSITLDKSAGAPTGNTAGSTIAYSFLVTNTGNVTLTAVASTDAKVGTVTCPVTTLAPAASTTCTGDATR